MGDLAAKTQAYWLGLAIKPNPFGFGFWCQSPSL